MLPFCIITLVHSKMVKQSPLLYYLSSLLKYSHCSPCRQWIICLMLTVFFGQCKPLTKESDIFLKSTSVDLQWSPAECSEQLQRTGTSSLVHEGCKNIWDVTFESTLHWHSSADIKVNGSFISVGAVKPKPNALLSRSKLQEWVTRNKAVWNSPGCRKEKDASSANDVQNTTNTMPRTEYQSAPGCLHNSVSSMCVLPCCKVQAKKRKAVIITDCQGKCHQHERPPGAEISLKRSLGSI